MFKYVKRGEDNICVFSDKATEELKSSVREAHGERLPDDWIFDKYCSILDTLSGYDITRLEDIDNYRPEIVDSLVDVYTSDLTGWLHSSNYNVGYIDEAAEEYGEPQNGLNSLQMAQYKAIDNIFSFVYDLISDSSEEDEEEEENNE